MAIKKVRIRPEGGNNYADIVHPETTASVVIEETDKRFMTDAERTKLSGVATSANKYEHPTTAGNKHIPTGGTVGQILKNTTSGTATWQSESVTPISNNLTETVTGKALDATQGKGLKDAIDVHVSEKATQSGYGHIRLQDITEASGKKVVRFVIGTSTAGWTTADCDYLCDGTADDVEINAAITALPATGGEVVILDGTYNITAKIDVNKDNVSIKGNGNATVLKRMFNSSVAEGVITLTSRSGCKIANLQIDGNKTSYTNYYNRGILLVSSSNNTVTGSNCNNNNYGIDLSGSSNNIITGSTCNNNNNYGILLNSSSNNTITGSTCNNNNYGIDLSGSSNIITGSTCNNNNNYGINLNSSSNNTITGNACNNNSYGIYFLSSSNNIITGSTCNNNNNYGICLNSSSNNTITGNACIRGTGLTTDYTTSQYTIRLMGADNSYNLIAMNNCMGKAVTNAGGTGNTLVNNKFDAT